MSAPMSALCSCGHTKAQHDIDDPLDWPCDVPGCPCDNFDDAGEEDDE